MVFYCKLWENDVQNPHISKVDIQINYTRRANKKPSEKLDSSARTLGDARICLVELRTTTESLEKSNVYRVFS